MIHAIMNGQSPLLQTCQEQLQRSQDLVTGLQGALATERQLAEAAAQRAADSDAKLQARAAAAEREAEEATGAMAQLRSKVAVLEASLNQQRFTAVLAHDDLRRVQVSRRACCCTTVDWSWI